jgi:hypothetical protein
LDAVDFKDAAVERTEVIDGASDFGRPAGGAAARVLLGLSLALDDADSVPEVDPFSLLEEAIEEEGPSAELDFVAVEVEVIDRQVRTEVMEDAMV